MQFSDLEYHNGQDTKQASYRRNIQTNHQQITVAPTYIATAYKYNGSYSHKEI